MNVTVLNFVILIDKNILLTNICYPISAAFVTTDTKLANLIGGAVEYQNLRFRGQQPRHTFIGADSTLTKWQLSVLLTILNLIDSPVVTTVVLPCEKDILVKNMKKTVTINIRAHQGLTTEHYNWFNLKSNKCQKMVDYVMLRLRSGCSIFNLLNLNSDWSMYSMYVCTVSHTHAPLFLNLIYLSSVQVKKFNIEEMF